ncbi:hypothetical protein OHB12_15485 [Nocardia sp. NBC_01730]|uniref:Gfo/Idh/MocA family oxidoreductase n=1 Tax=Nocardia sp. NBC_01730 TaxID=2975998 RepID=UPI002E1572B8|nr:hypothetical protein OHB12_15485 [Nocardia sp. NBC_01730]
MGHDGSFGDSSSTSGSNAAWTTVHRCRRSNPTTPLFLTPAYPGFIDRFRRAYTEELAAFTSVVTGDLDNPYHPTDALEAFHIAEACELSRREARPVKVAEVR